MVMKYPNLHEEKMLWSQGYDVVAGLDEAGRGPLAGPVVAAAVMINPKHEIRNSKSRSQSDARIPYADTSASGQIQNSNIKNSKLVSNFDIRISSLKLCDSKQLSEKAREEFYEILTRHKDIEWGIGVVSEKIIDKINILEATKLAMSKAAKNLHADFLLIDGNFGLDFNEAAFAKKGFSVPKQKSVVKGDSKVFSIAAASIIAKVTRDRLMQKFHKKYPQYGFLQHKGYGTALHLEKLKTLGPCKIHRKSFYPVSSFV